MSKWFRFRPTKEVFFVLASWLMVVSAFYTAFNIFTTKRVALNFITFGVIGITLLGITVPLVWNCIIKKRPLSDLGVKRDKLVLSIVLGVIFSIIQYYITIRNIAVPPMTELIPLTTMALAVGLYENIFYRGWVQLRIEEYFSIIPGIILSAVIYSLYHVGYGMNMDEMIVLLVVGLVYSVIFRLTSNIFILFPFLTPTGALFSQIKDGLRLPFPSTYGFADVILVCIIILFAVNKVSKRRNTKVQTM
jgi:membrane protease YdiL (CAAX protease family)